MVDHASGTPSLTYIHTDQVAQPQKMTDASGNIVWDRVATPFGVEVSLTGILTQSLRFPGQTNDPETSLNQNWHREYAPELGRYVQSDPIGLMGGINIYAYVAGNPITRVDPRGTETVFIGGAGDRGSYKSDFVRAFNEAGISNTRGSNPSVTTGGRLPGGFIPDALLGVPMLNQDLGENLALYDPALGRTSNDPQFNLVGYSWGAVIAAHQAIAMAQRGECVNNLVLIGAPINQSLKDRLDATSGIGNIIYKNLSDQGDPIYPGISDHGLAASTPELMAQMLQNSGHFYYSGTGATGAGRRNALAQELFNAGLR